MDKIVLIGGGGHCKSCIDVIEQEKKFEIVGVLDTKEKVGKKVLDYLVEGTDSQIERFANEGCHFLITLGQIEKADLRIEIYEKLKAVNAKIATVISPLAYVSKHAKIEAGTIVLHHALINAGAKIGKNCIINSKALIEHDAVIEDFCHISTGAIVNGGSVVGEKSFVGSNSAVAHCAKVLPKSFVKAGSIIK